MIKVENFTKINFLKTGKAINKISNYCYGLIQHF